jgi:hypothetical protein
MTVPTPADIARIPREYPQVPGKSLATGINRLIRVMVQHCIEHPTDLDAVEVTAKLIEAHARHESHRLAARRYNDIMRPVIAAERNA